MKEEQEKIKGQLDGIRMVASAFANSWLRHSDPASRLPTVFSKLAISCDDAIFAFERQRVEFGDQNTVACKSGCDYCCRQLVVATPMEVFALIAWIRENRTDGEINEIKDRAERYLELFLSNDPSLPTSPCPVLKDGLCSGYGGRPFICRGYHSFDLGACETKFKQENADLGIPHNHPAYLTATLMRNEVAAKISELSRPSPQVYLGPAVAIALREECCLDRWLAGENVFAGLEYKPSP
ncbi:MAG: YkgJ family cysteine cluster protein [Armatimonadetes bacterium]|nr:YkgJ family cysteine cluster protein [Armatimonadota bacterium]